MRFSTGLLLALPALAAAQQQIPLLAKVKDLYDAATSYVENAIPRPTGDPGSANVAAEQVASGEVKQLTLDNYQETIQHSGEKRPYDPPEAWMVYITGGNKTCNGLCDVPDKAWNESVALFSRDVSAPHLAQVNCDSDELLCGAWLAYTSSIWLILVPQPMPDQSKGEILIFQFDLNLTTTTNGDITRIHTRKPYLAMEPYKGVMHPFDGPVAKLGLIKPLAYTLWGLSKIPSWGFMVFLSMFSRYYMGRRMPQPRAAQAGTRPAAAAPGT